MPPIKKESLQATWMAIALALALGCLQSSVFGTSRGPRYRATSLGQFFGIRINDAGHVAGSTSADVGVLWRDGKLIPLLGLANTSIPSAMNNHGQIVGRAGITFSAPLPFIWNEMQMDQIELLDPGDHPYAINDRGHIAGSLAIHAGQSNDAGFLIDGERLIVFGGQPPWHNQFFYVTGMNNSEVVVGRGGYIGIGMSAFRYQDGVLERLPTLGGVLAAAWDVSDAGHIVGGSQVIDSPGFHACMWHENEVTDLGTLPGFGSDGRAVNDSGVVAGFCGQGSIPEKVFKATVWVDRQLHLVEDMVVNAPAPDISYMIAWDVNNLGQVVVESFSPSLGSITVLLDPVAPADLDADGVVNGLDLGILLSQWLAPSPGLADLNEDGSVDGVDLGILLANWS